MENLLRGHSVRTVAVDGVSAEFVTDPVLVRRILVKDSKNYGKGELFRKARNLSRAGLLTEDESVHRHYRRLTHPYLRTAAVAEYAQVMHEIAREAVTSWRLGQAVDVQAEMCRISSAVALRTLFHGVPREASALLGEHLAALSWEMMRKPLYGKAATRAERQLSSRRLSRTRADFRGLLASCMADLLHSPDCTEGYLSALLTDSGKHGTPVLTPDEVCDEAVMMLTAATVTTASVMSWALYVISQDPLIEEKVLKDMAQTGGESVPLGNGHGPVGYTVRFLMEVLRLYPPVWITCRRTLSDVTLGDYSFARGTQVLFSSYLLHRNPDRYPDPYRFDPDRWLSIRPTTDDASYIPFGIGAKGCVGESFAWKELEILLGAVIQEWQLMVEPGSRVRKAAETTLHPRRLLMVPQPR
ncbi:cytochrome P450 (plasmid) [Streptomyces sp. NBC_01483]